MYYSVHFHSSFSGLMMALDTHNDNDDGNVMMGLRELT